MTTDQTVYTIDVTLQIIANSPEEVGEILDNSGIFDNGEVTLTSQFGKLDVLYINDWGDEATPAYKMSDVKG